MSTEGLKDVERRQFKLAKRWLRAWAREWLSSHPEVGDVEAVVDGESFLLAGGRRAVNVYSHSAEPGSTARNWQVRAAEHVRIGAFHLFIHQPVGARWRFTQDGRCISNKKARSVR